MGNANRNTSSVSLGGVHKAAARLRALVRAYDVLLIPLALIIGVIAGSTVTLISEIAQLAHVVIYGIPIDVRLSANSTVNPLAAAIAPAAGGLILGIMEWSRRRWKIAQAVDPIEANALRGGHLSIRDSVVVTTQTLISNGCGASVGLEAGYTQIGAGAASLLGRKLNLRRSDLRLMVGCGAAGAISAAFGAPLTGAFYAFELIVGVYSIASAAPILAASISAALIANWLGGAPYSLEASHLVAVAGEQYPSLIALGLLTGLLGIGIIRASSWLERIFNQKWLPVWGRPVLGGFCVGAMAMVTPQVLGAGHGAMVLNLNRDMAATLIITIVVLKLSACLISLASGFRGGLFFASLFVGCMIGKLYAVLLHVSSIDLSLDPTTSALTGMACLGVAIVGGPLTMSFLVLEMTRNLEVSAGVLAACFVTSVAVRGIFGHSFSTWRLHLRGETVRSANDIGWLRNLTVGRMMRTDVPLIVETATVAECIAEFATGAGQARIIVGADHAYRGIILSGELNAAAVDPQVRDRPAIDYAKYVDTFLLPAMNVKMAMKAFDQAEADVLAVVENVTSRKIVGFLNESYAGRRYVEELDRATNSLVA